MIGKFAIAIARWLVYYEVIGEDEFELYEFAGYSFLMTFTPLTLAIFVGIAMGRLISTVEIILPFMLIRKFSGGFHAKRPWVCLLCSSFILYISIVCSDFITCKYGLIFITIISSFLLVVCSPIASENRLLDAKERQIYKKFTVVIVVINLVISIFLFVLGKDVHAKYCSIGIILASIMQIPCVIKKIVCK